MAEITATVRSRLADVFGGRNVVLAGGVLAGSVPAVTELRAAGAARILLLPTSVGTGPLPEGDDLVVEMHVLPPVDGATAQFRSEEALFASPPEHLVAHIARFVGADDEPLVLAPPFSAVERFGPFALWAPRRAAWVALEDKTRADACFDAAGVPHPPSRVRSVAAANGDDLDRGAGTVWSGDARDGFNGGAEYVRWIRDESTRAAAVDFFQSRCDRVRVSPFVEGIPCSIHGIVTDADVAALRPVEIITFHTNDDRGFRYAGAASYYDPPDVVRTAMRDAVRRLGAYLRDFVEFRGSFTIDGIVSADGWVATECNPRSGAALAYMGVCAPELSPGLMLRAISNGLLADLDMRALEALVLERSDAQRWGGAWTPTTTTQTETHSTKLVGDASGYRAAVEAEQADATLLLGPSPVGGFVRFTPEPGRTPSGPSIAPRAAAAFQFADAALGTGLGELRPARDVSQES
jgi:hypothetical protein